MDNPQNSNNSSDSAGELLEGVKTAEFDAAASLSQAIQHLEDYSKAVEQFQAVLALVSNQRGEIEKIGAEAMASIMQTGKGILASIEQEHRQAVASIRKSTQSIDIENLVRRIEDYMNRLSHR